MNPKFIFYHLFRLLLLFLILFSLQTTSAQQNSTINKRPPKGFLGMGIGINDYGVGIIGLEKPLNDKFSMYGMGGLSTWGFRATGGLTYYLKESAFGSSFSLGYSYSSGLDELETELEAFTFSDGDEIHTYYFKDYSYGYLSIDDKTDTEVTLKLFSYSTINLMYSYNLEVGKKSKFVFSGGYSIPMENNIYKVESGHLITDKSRKFIDFMAPGGLILGVKFMQGI